MPAASTDESRPILTGVLLAAEADGLRLVATDSYRLAVRDLPGTSVLAEGQSVLVPSSALNELQRVLGSADEVTLRLGERDAILRASATCTLTTRLIEGEFPNYRGLIPSAQPNRLTVGREALLDAVRRVRLMAREVHAGAARRCATDGLELIAITQDVGQASEAARRQVRGRRADRGVQPRVPARGHRGVAPATRSRSRRVDALKPALLRSIDSRTSSTC